MRTLSGGNSRTLLAALIVFFISMATVMGPTPPGTGVMYPAFFLTPEYVQEFVTDRTVKVRNSEILLLCCTFKVHISHQPVLSCDWVLHAIYSHVDDCCALFDHVCCDQVGNSCSSIDTKNEMNSFRTGKKMLRCHQIMFLQTNLQQPQ